MDLFFILIQQLLVMVIFMAVGYCLCKGGLVTMTGCKELGNLLLYVILPAAILNSYHVERTAEKTRWLLISFAASLAALALSMAVSAVLFRGKKSKNLVWPFPMLALWAFPSCPRCWGRRPCFTCPPSWPC